MEKIKLPIMVGKLDMSLEMFYDGFDNETNKGKYTLAEVFKGVIDKYPPICDKITFTNNNHVVNYGLNNVDVVVQKDLLSNETVSNIWKNVKDVKCIETEEELSKLNVYKVKILKEDGVFSERTLLHENHGADLIDLQPDFYMGKEFYKFFAYTYAAYIETKAEIKTYEEYKEYYSKYVYGMTMQHNDKTLGLTWLDFISHAPDAHLEFGSNSNLCGVRFKEFNTWEKGDTITFTIMAEGHKDIVLSVKAKAAPAIKWSDGWYHKALKMRDKKIEKREK